MNTQRGLVDGKLVGLRGTVIKGISRVQSEMNVTTAMRDVMFNCGLIGTSILLFHVKAEPLSIFCFW